MWWFLLFLLAVGALAAPVAWAITRVAKLRFRENDRQEVAVENVSPGVITGLKNVVEPLLELGYEFETVRKDRGESTESWQAILSSAGGAVWAAIQSEDGIEGRAESVNLYSFAENGAAAVTGADGDGFQLPQAEIWQRKGQFASPLEQSEAHAELLQSEGIPLVTLSRAQFLEVFDGMRQQNLDGLFEEGWLKETAQERELKLDPKKWFAAALLFLKSNLAERLKGQKSPSWWEPAPEVVEEELAQSVATAEGKVAEESGTILEEGAKKEASHSIAGETWAGDVELYEQEAGEKSWAYWLRGHGSRALLFLSLVGFVLWLMVVGRWSASFAFFVLLAFVIHELGHLVTMSLRRNWDWSYLLIPIPRPMAAKAWPIQGGWGEVLTLLAGSLPGLIFGWSVLAYGFGGGTAGDPLFDFALAAVLVNSFLLLPIRPLDGGRLMDIIILRRVPSLRIVGLIVGGLLLMVAAFRGFGAIGAVGALLLWTAIPFALRRGRLLPWMRENLSKSPSSPAPVGLAVLHERGSAKFVKGPGGFARFDELLGVAMAKVPTKGAVLLSLLVLFLALVAPVVLPSAALGQRVVAWFSAKEEAKVLVQEYLGSRPSGEEGENTDYDMRLLQEGFATYPDEPERVFTDSNILTAVREMKWSTVGQWIDEEPVERQQVLADCVNALRRDAMKSADAGSPERAFNDLSVAVRILVHCEPRDTFSSWLEWSELEGEVLRELEEASSRYPLEDRFMEWYEGSLAQAPEATSRKLAGLLLQEKAGLGSLTLQDPKSKLLGSERSPFSKSPGRSFITLFQRAGHIVPVEKLEEEMQLAKLFSKSPKPLQAAGTLAERGFDTEQLGSDLKRIESNRAFREIAICAFRIKRLGLEGASESLAKLEQDQGYRVKVDVDGDRESLQLSRLNDDGELLEMEWVLKQ